MTSPDSGLNSALLNAARELVDRNVYEGRGEKTAILCGERAVSYRALKTEVDRVARALLRSGIREGERVAILLPDGPEFAIAFFAAMKIGAVAVPLSTLLSAAEHRFMLRDSDAAALVFAQDFHTSISKPLPDLPRLRVVVAVGPRGEAAPPPSGACDWRDWIDSLNSACDVIADAAPTRERDPAFWLYTSGTTGKPKAAVHLHHHMLDAADLYAKGVLGLREDDVCFSVAKLFFAYGLGNGLYFPFRVGATAVHLPGKPTPGAVFAVIARHAPTVFYSVPTSFVGLGEEARRRELRSLGRVRLAVSAGEHLPAAVFEEWRQRFGVEILDGIGSTEILHIFIANRPARARAGSTGEIVPGYEARVEDETGRELPSGQVGDLVIHGPTNMPEYWARPEESARTVRDGWIRTGDKFHRDADGYFWFHGRTDDMLKVSGYWVSPAEVEAAITSHADVLECAVVGRRDERGLDRPLAWIVPREGAGPPATLIHNVRAFLAGRLAPFKIPAWFEIAEALPRTATGKLQRFKLRSGRPLC